MKLLANKAAEPGALAREALELAKTHSLNRNSLDWAELEPDYLRRAEACATLPEAHALIRQLLKTLNDGHSFLRTPGDTRQAQVADFAGFQVHLESLIVTRVDPDSPAERAGVVTGDRVVAVNDVLIDETNWRSHFWQAVTAGTRLRLERRQTGAHDDLVLETGFPWHNLPPTSSRLGEVARLELPGHDGDGQLADGSDYAEHVRRATYTLEAEGARAWIVDLRRNDGGNMWPVLGGLTPLLGGEPYGAFSDPVSGVSWAWRFDGERLYCESDTGEQVTQLRLEPQRPLQRPHAPVAVLTSALTASSGEAVATALQGRPATRTFGVQTSGLTTSNDRFDLLDGSWLLLATTLEADRLGRVYKAGVRPDEHVETDWSCVGEPHDPVILRARAWLRKQL